MLRRPCYQALFKQHRRQFSKLTAADADFFRSVLGPQNLLVRSKDCDESEFEQYDRDWMRKYQGRSSAVLRPASTDQVSAVLRYCNDRKLAVVPQGGNTGLVGGSVPVHDEIVISTRNMNKITSFDQTSGILQCQSGCILEVLDNYLAERGFVMPLDLGAKGSCHIGGNLATNAGGLRLLRYGSLHGTVLGVEAVLPDGTVYDGLSTLRKDNTGYDLKQLFIGSEGTLGILTTVSILTPPRPKSFNAALLALRSFEDVCKVFDRRRQLSEILSAFEFWDQQAHELVRKHLSHLKSPLTADGNAFFVLIETSGSSQEHDSEKLEQFLSGLMEDGLIVDGTVASDMTQFRDLWAIRESIPEACAKSGYMYKYDVSIPVPRLYQLVEDTRRRLTHLGVDYESLVGFGHMGDGNLHLNVATAKASPAMQKALEPFIYEWTQRHGGSISAEHGLGQMKAPYLQYSKSETNIRLMRQIKNLFDPNGIMNPYKYLPQEK